MSRLIGVLTKFCIERVVLMADINAMFHQVRVPPEDCDLLRFFGGLTEIVEGSWLTISLPQHPELVSPFKNVLRTIRTTSVSLKTLLFLHS